CKTSGKSCLEMIMEDDGIILERLCEKDYIECLSKFKFRTLIAIPHGDIIVPFPSASLRSFNPYKEPEVYEINFSNKYYRGKADCLFMGVSGFSKEYNEKILKNIPKDNSIINSTNPIKSGNFYHCDN